MIHSSTSETPAPSGRAAPDPDVLLELHRELWAAQHRQAAATPGTHARLDADAAVSWFEWLLVDYLQRAAPGPTPAARPDPADRPAA